MNLCILFSQLVLNWYHQYGRKNLPWKKNANPYHTWISEVMLQQTQVKTVIPYYKKFIKHFPNIKILANTSINNILNIWSGLGYYNRAHNIYYTAQIIEKKYHGQFPNHFSNIIKLPGIGRTTAGAILSFGFNFHACILDGNVKRVLLRYFSIREKTKTITEKKLWKKIESITPIYNTKQFNQAIIDIGALICVKSKPKCNICPLKKTCASFIKNDWSTYPYVQKKIIINQKNIYFLIIQYQNFIFLKKNTLTGIWKGLYCFPIFYNQTEILIWIKEKKIKLVQQEMFKSFLHKFSHLQFFCIPIRIQIKKMFYTDPSKNEIWFNMYSQEDTIGLPSPIIKLFKTIFHAFILNFKEFNQHE
ncbi:MAG: A/G-specific adenine glycosylase [Buchnera aphidicola (Kaburagia rhusicola rhusicola)]